MSDRTAIEIAKEAKSLPNYLPIVVTPEEWELLNEVASDPDRRRYCTRLNGSVVLIDRNAVEAHSGPVWATELEYTGE